MSLESAAWREHGPAAPRPGRRVTWGDRLARTAAFLILVGIFAFSAFALSYTSFGVPLLLGLLIVAIVGLFFRVRELSRTVAEQKAALETIRSSPPTAQERAP